MACKRFFVRGKVQGVWFRASARRQAERLGLTGHALNLPDGRVEVLACGEEASVDTLAAWLWHGPDLAVVEDVSSERFDGQPPIEFHTG